MRDFPLCVPGPRGVAPGVERSVLAVKLIKSPGGGKQFALRKVEGGVEGGWVGVCRKYTARKKEGWDGGGGCFWPKDRLRQTNGVRT